MNLEADNIVTEAKNAIFQTQSKNSTIQFQNVDEKLKKLGELKRMDPTKLTHKQRNFITSMTSLGSRMFNSLENTTASAIAFKDQSGIKLGSQGSNDKYRNKGQFETMSIMNGTLPGSKEAFYDEDENGNVVYSVSVKNAKGVVVGKILNNDLETTMFVDKVPNLQPDINKAIQKAKAILNIESEFSDAYSKDNGDDIIGVNNKGVGITATVWEQALKAQIDLIALGLDNNEKSSFHNNITRTKSIQVTESNIKKLNKEVEKRNQAKADGEKSEKLYAEDDIIKDTENNLWEYDIKDFGSEKNTVTSVYEVVKKIINIWGSGKIKIKHNQKYYEQKNLQLNISKAKKILKWVPFYTINQAVKTTVEWYKNVYLRKITPRDATINQIMEYYENVKKSKKNST